MIYAIMASTRRRARRLQQNATHLPRGVLRMQRILILAGLVAVVLGLLWPWLSKLGLGRLPGDIRIENESGGFYFPITTSIIISIVLSLLLWIFRR
jgi:hypothetical protein